MRLEGMLNGLKRKVATAAMLGSLVNGCSSDSNNKGITQPRVPTTTQPKNNLPVVTSNPITQINEHGSYEYTIQATDADGDPLSYSVQSPEWLSVSHNVVFGNAPETLKDSTVSVKLKIFDGKESVDHNYPLNVKNLFNSYTVSQRDVNSLIAEGDSNLTFSKPVNFNVGDILGSEISQATPYGILREITSISNDKLKVNTKQATLEKIIRDGSFSVRGNLSQLNVQSFAAARQGISQNLNIAESEPKFGINLTNVVLYDIDGNPLTKNDQLIANGKIEISTDFDFSADVRGIRLNSLDFKNKSSVTSEIVLGSNILGLAAKKEVALGEYYFSPIIIAPPVTPIPIVVVPKMGLYVGIDPTKVNPLSVKVNQDSNLETSLIYDGSWNSSSNFSSNFVFSNPVINGDWNLSVYASPRLTLLFGGVLGTSAGVSTNLRLDASIQTGDWKLYGGLGANLGVSMEVFAKNISAYSKNIVAYEKLLAQGKAQLPALKTDTLFAEKDAYISWSNIPNSSWQNTNYNSTVLNLKKDEGRSYQTTLVEFPINSLPANANIISASFNIFGYCVNNSLSPNVNINFTKITSNWGENSVTWNTQPTYNTTLSNLLFPVRTNTKIDRDITSLVKDWSSNRNQNYGIALGLVDNESICVFSSRENTDLSKRPRIIVSYR